jgi:hypothetical protein
LAKKHDNFEVDLEEDTMSLDGVSANIPDFWINDIFDISLNLKIAATYTDINGKFNQVYGNVGIVDCNYTLQAIIDAVRFNLDKIKRDRPAEWFIINNIITSF